ncbi:MAG: hypothetical protein K6F33_11860 [Bacteroidales bacterium]|nr:hypothetical protein [Bacteroidales bacterium]
MVENSNKDFVEKIETELKKIFGNKVFIDRFLKEHLSEALTIDGVKLIVLNAYLNTIRNILREEDVCAYPKVEELLFNDAQNKVSLKDDIKKAVNVVIDAGLNILNNDAVCNNQGSRYYDCFEDYRKMFNKLKECIN